MNVIMNIWKKIRSGGGNLLNDIICKTIYKKKFGNVAGVIKVGKNVTFQHPECLFFGKDVIIQKHTYFLPCKQYAGVKYQPKIVIGDGCRIGIRNSFACIDSIKIGKEVLFAGYVHITDHSHGYEDIEKPITVQPLISKGGVEIGDHCWLGFSCEILSGVHIGKHSIVAARAVVTKDVPPYSIVAGNPARIVKQYNFETKKWEKPRNI